MCRALSRRGVDRVANCEQGFEQQTCSYYPSWEDGRYYIFVVAGKTLPHDERSMSKSDLIAVQIIVTLEAACRLGARPMVN